MRFDQLTSNTGNDDQGYSTGWDRDILCRTNVAPIKDNLNNNQLRFGASHPQSFNVVYADGKVTGIDYSVDTVLFSLLGDRMDGNAVQAP